jgi:hypothetical protein
MAKLGFHKGWSGSPFHTGYEGNKGAETGPDGKPSERGPRIGSGVLGMRVETEVTRDGSSPMRGKRRRDGAEE